MKNGKLCGEAISAKHGPTVLRNHIMYCHADEYARVTMELLRQKQPAVDESAADVKVKQQMQLPSVTSGVRDSLHRAHARWLVKRKRPFRLTEDEEYRELWKEAMHGTYMPPDHHTIKAHVFNLSVEGKLRLFDINKQLLAASIKPGMSGDIWSSGGVSLLGLCHYHISADWNIKEMVLAATPFNKERHTGVAIDDKTRDACVEAGLPHDVLHGVFFPVSDNGANIVKGWSGFGRGPCCVHTVQLSVKLFLDHPEIKPTREKQRAIVKHFSQSTGIDGLGAFHECQRKQNLPEHEFIKDCDTRWSGAHDQMEFFRKHQAAVQLYDVNHARKAGNAYKEHQLDLGDWLVNLQSVAVLQPIADWTQHMQGTKSYPTLPLVLPTLYSLIEGMAPDAPLKLAFPREVPYELTRDEMDSGTCTRRAPRCITTSCRDGSSL